MSVYASQFPHAYEQGYSVSRMSYLDNPSQMRSRPWGVIGVVFRIAMCLYVCRNVCSGAVKVQFTTHSTRNRHAMNISNRLHRIQKQIRLMDRPEECENLKNSKRNDTV